MASADTDEVGHVAMVVTERWRGEALVNPE
jgi:hypothetical protein